MWQHDETRALASMLLGRTLDAEELLARPLPEALDPED